MFPVLFLSLCGPFTISFTLFSPCLLLLLLFHLLSWATAFHPRSVTTFYISVSNLLQLFINIKTWCSFYSLHFENKLFFPNRKSHTEYVQTTPPPDSQVLITSLCTFMYHRCLRTSDPVCRCLSNQSFFLLSTPYPTYTYLSQLQTITNCLIKILL